MFNDAGIAKHDAVARYITVYKTIRRNQNIVSDSDITHHSCVYTNPYGITDFWCALARTSIFLSYCNTFMQIAVFSYFCSLIYCNIIRMSKIKTFSYIASE